MRRRSDLGFTLLETLLALFIIGAALAGVVRLTTLAARANALARSTTMATVLAGQKMEQLRALGSGLAETAHADALLRNVDGHCDFFDEAGQPVGDITFRPAGAAYVRRWSVQRITGATGAALLLQVVVRPEGRGLAGLGIHHDDARLIGGAHIVWMKALAEE